MFYPFTSSTKSSTLKDSFTSQKSDYKDPHITNLQSINKDI